MPPTDFVDDRRDVTCLLGLNINAGQEIKLRLRTADLKGFRKYQIIRETLVHELTHNVWGEHDNNFKELNSRLLRECVRLTSQSALTHKLVEHEVRSTATRRRLARPCHHRATLCTAVMSSGTSCWQYFVHLLCGHRPALILSCWTSVNCTGCMCCGLAVLALLFCA
jgi:WLM domain